jgi:hypothetical protein
VLPVRGPSERLILYRAVNTRLGYKNDAVLFHEIMAGCCDNNVKQME